MAELGFLESLDSHTLCNRYINPLSTQTLSSNTGTGRTQILGLSANSMTDFYPIFISFLKLF